MKAAEILRKLADMIDSHSDEGSVERPTNSVQHAELAPVEVDHTDNTETTVMVPPLQAKLELLKKATGVDSHYDDAESCEVCGQCPCACEEPDELAIIKQNAGVADPVVVHVAADDDLLG